MDTFNVEALIAQGKVISTSDIDPNNDYLVVGKWQTGNRKKGGDGNSYPSYAIPIGAIMSGGGGSDKNYVHVQLAPSTTWVVNHNLGKRCSVNVANSSGTEIGVQVVWNSDNQVTISSNLPINGFVYCN